MHLFLICVSDTWALLLGLYGRYFYIVYSNENDTIRPWDVQPSSRLLTRSLSKSRLCQEFFVCSARFCRVCLAPANSNHRSTALSDVSVLWEIGQIGCTSMAEDTRTDAMVAAALAVASVTDTGGGHQLDCVCGRRMVGCPSCSSH